MLPTRAVPAHRPAYPLWAVLPFTLLVLVIVPIYWVEYGPQNFLWFSDIALFMVLVALWTGNRLLYSMAAVGVLPLEIVWTIDFLTGGSLGGLAAYMFDESYPLWLRALSLFHIPLWLVIVWMLRTQGYDRRAFWGQTLLAWIVLPLSWWLATPEENINWVHGLGPDGHELLSPPLYLGVYVLALPLLVFLPMHLLLKRFSPRPRFLLQNPAAEPSFPLARRFEWRGSVSASCCCGVWACPSASCCSTCWLRWRGR